MSSDAKFNEMKKMLSDALKRITVLEGKLQEKENKLYRYFIPEKDADGNNIDKARRKDYLKVLQEGACKDNTGYTQYYGHGAHYQEKYKDEPFDPKKIQKERTIIFDTYGKNPMTPERLKRCQKLLYQNSLGIMSCDSYEFIDSNKIGPYALLPTK